MAIPGISGFGAILAVDDGGTGAAKGSASTAFDGVTEFNLPSIEAGKFETGELNPASAFESELPTGSLKLGTTKCSMKFSKANYTRLNALAGDRGYTFVLTSPDDLTATPGPTKLICTFVGFISMVGEVTYNKANQVVIPFEITVSGAPALT